MFRNPLNHSTLSITKKDETPQIACHINGFKKPYTVPVLTKLNDNSDIIQGGNYSHFGENSAGHLIFGS